MKQILVNFGLKFKQNNANGGRNSFQQIRGERGDIGTNMYIYYIILMVFIKKYSDEKQFRGLG